MYYQEMNEEYYRQQRPERRGCPPERKECKRMVCWCCWMEEDDYRGWYDDDFCRCMCECCCKRDRYGQDDWQGC